MKRKDGIGSLQVIYIYIYIFLLYIFVYYKLPLCLITQAEFVVNKSTFVHAK